MFMFFTHESFKLCLAIACKANRHFSLGLLTGKNREILTSTCAFRFCSNGPNVIPITGPGDINEDSSETLTFDDIVSLRRKQAKKTVLIEASSKSNLENIYKICKKFGPIQATFNYSQASGKEIFLVECETLEMQQELLKYCHYPNESLGLHVHSRLLYLSSHVKSTNCTMLEHSVQEKTVPCDTLAVQMEKMYVNERLQDLGTRLRFLICQLVEDAIVGLFPHAEVLPFGSTVNGFGRNNCDLDMTLQFNTCAAAQKTHYDSELCFFTRRQATSGKRQTQQNLEVIGDLIKTFFPGVDHVNKILRARIPIIDFYHNLTGIECDLSLTNRCAYYMSELLYLYGELDPRVRPLVFTVRSWAKKIGLTQPVAGPYISNFTLTMMVLFFLQNRPVPILPSMKSLVQLADPDDYKYAEGIDCTFQRKILKIPRTENTEDAGDLLLGFFFFCEKFNFNKNGLSLFTGKEHLKPDGSIIYIENPLERQLNVSVNVGVAEVDRLRDAVRSSIWKMESSASADRLNKLLEIEPADHFKDSQNGAYTVGHLFQESKSDSVHYVVTVGSKKKKLSTAISENNVNNGLVRKLEHDTEKLQTKSNSNSKKNSNNLFGANSSVDKRIKSRPKKRNNTGIFKNW